MTRLYRVAEDVSRGLMLLADELREAGLVEQAGRCDAMALTLDRARHDSMADTQPIEVARIKLHQGPSDPGDT